MYPNDLSNNILLVLKTSFPLLSATKLAKTLNVSYTTMQRQLSFLTSKDLIKLCTLPGHAPASLIFKQYYEITPKGIAYLKSF
jgi:predicted transcriptional regulator